MTEEPLTSEEVIDLVTKEDIENDEAVENDLKIQSLQPRQLTRAFPIGKGRRAFQVQCARGREI